MSQVDSRTSWNWIPNDEEDDYTDDEDPDEPITTPLAATPEELQAVCDELFDNFITFPSNC